MSDNTYSSFLTAGFLKVCGNDDSCGKDIKNYTLFENLESY